MLAKKKMNTEDINNCEHILKNLVELQSSVGHFTAKQYKMLAEYLRPQACNDESFEYRIERAYGGFLFDRTVKIVNAEYHILKPKKIEAS